MYEIRELEQIEINQRACIIVTVPPSFEEHKTCIVVYSNQGKVTTREAKFDGDNWEFVPCPDGGGYLHESHPAFQKLKRVVNGYTDQIR
jgi:hypothetical protein